MALLNLISPVADTRKGYWPALDGLRAISVLGVVAVHSGLHWGHAGGFGVQVFFVLSGFLITSLLLREYDRSGRINIGSFYRRRALRLFPALAVFLLVCGAISLPLSAPFRSQTLSAIPFSVFYSFNWVQALNDPPVGLVTHTWSLAIEEQFYLIWPLLVVLVLRLGGGPRTLFALALGAALLSAAWAHLLWTDGLGVARIYYGSDTGAAPLMIGCAAGILYVSVQWKGLARSFCQAAGVIGALMIVIGFVKSWPPDVAYGAGVTAIFAFGVACAVLGLAAAPVRAVELLLSLPPLVLLGRISYGIYLWQGPVFILLIAYAHFNTWMLLAAGLPLTLLVSIASYRFVERPFLRMKNGWRPNRTVAAIPAGEPDDRVGRAYSVTRDASQ
jgi:peptidoglycan/LPS O-acetylase OafA/YrhL